MQLESQESSSREDSYRKDGKGEALNTISIVIGILSYLLLFMKSMFWTTMFCIFSFKTNLPSCIAVYGIEQPINLLEQMSGSDPQIEA